MPGYEVLGEEEKKEILEVLETGVLFRYGFPAQRQGRYKVEEFEKAFAAFTGRKHALAVSSGSTALRVALAALGVGFGDEVITTGFTFVATWEAILEAGAVPVFTEIDDTLTMDPKDLEKKITPRTRAVIPVHMLGAQANIEPILEVACRHNLSVLEDTAQAAGGFIRGKHLGSFGVIGTFSFDSVKTLTTGEGGMLIMDDPELFRRASEYHDHGHDHIGTDRGLEGSELHRLQLSDDGVTGGAGTGAIAETPGDDRPAARKQGPSESHPFGAEGDQFPTSGGPRGRHRHFSGLFPADL